jgi:hypothetical protein
MTLCPIALAVGCPKCFAFSVCPLKTIIGDLVTTPAPPAKAPPTRKPPPKRKRRPRKQ